MENVLAIMEVKKGVLSDQQEISSVRQLLSMLVALRPRAAITLLVLSPIYIVIGIFIGGR